MSRVGFEIVAIVVSFINTSWEPYHVTIGIFEVHNIASATMANQVKSLLDSFDLIDKVIAYVKDEGSNLNTLTSALTSIVSCSTFQLACPFVRSCFGHVMSKVARYAIDNTKVYAGLLEVNLKKFNLCCKRPLLRQKNLGRDFMAFYGTSKPQKCYKVLNSPTSFQEHSCNCMYKPRFYGEL
jgi:hypothetical protein